MNDKSALLHNTTTDFLVQPPGQAFKAKGFYDYGRGLLSLRIDYVNYALSISSDGVLTGTSNDLGGSASISGKLDPATRRLSFSKQYGFANLWARWKYEGELSEDGSRISGVWDSPVPWLAVPGIRRGRFGIWLSNHEFDIERAALETLLGSHDSVAHDV